MEEQTLNLPKETLSAKYSKLLLYKKVIYAGPSGRAD